MNIISHNQIQLDLNTVVECIKKKIIDNRDLYNETNVQEQLDILEELTKFEYGRWLLLNRGLNAHWSRYYMHFVIFGCYPASTHPLEIFMMQKAPSVLATYEEYRTRSELLDKYIKDGMCVGSVPCGYMDILLRLDLNKRKNVKFIGVDLDPEAIEGAKENASSLEKEDNCEFMIKDAWNLGIENKFDILMSNGLNMYAPNEETLTSLYTNMYNALKPNGYFFTNALMPPIDDTGAVYWKMDKVDLNDLKMQKIIFYNIIGIRQGYVSTEKQMITQLTKIGFKDIKVFYDTRKMYLSVVALKAS